MSLGTKIGITITFTSVAAIVTDIIANQQPTAVTLGGIAGILGGTAARDIAETIEEKQLDQENRALLAEHIKGLPKQKKEEVLIYMELEKLEVKKGSHKISKNPLLGKEEWKKVFIYADELIKQQAQNAPLDLQSPV